MAIVDGGQCLEAMPVKKSWGSSFLRNRRRLFKRNGV